MSDPRLSRRTVVAPDGAELSVLEGGQGPAVVLVHGFIASAERNWVAPGVAGALLDAGLRVVAPDLRGHGESARPETREAWPRDVLARDLQAVVAACAPGAYDLVGYSLGARTAVRGVVGGLRPRRLVLGGMGDTGIMEAGARAEMFRRSLLAAPGDPDPAARTIAAMVAQQGLSRPALLGVLDSFAETTADQLRAISIPARVICGDRDRDNGSGAALAALLADAQFVEVPGDHLTAVIAPELTRAVVEFVAPR